MTATQFVTDLDEPTVEIPAIDYVGRHRLPEPAFLDTFADAAVEHTAELVALAAEPTGLARFGRWFARNLTGARVTVLVGVVGVFTGTGLGWWLA